MWGRSPQPAAPPVPASAGGTAQRRPRPRPRRRVTGPDDVAAGWERDLYVALLRSRRRAWLVTAVASSTILLATLALWLLLPLREWSPYVLAVDRSTGAMELTAGLGEGVLDPVEAVARPLLIHYLEAREGYDPTDFPERVGRVSRLSAGDALARYRAQIADAHPQNPLARYGAAATVDVTVVEIALYPPRRSDRSLTAHVRFATATHTAMHRLVSQDRPRQHWVAAIRFAFREPGDAPASPASQEGPEAKERQRTRPPDPLAFRVLEYRRGPDRRAARGEE